MSTDLWVAGGVTLLAWLYLCYQTWQERHKPERPADDWETNWEGFTTENLCLGGNISEI
jgi:hypothetical protein